MATPARIRVNTAFPFPSLVNGSGPVTISKQQGIWTVGYSVVAFATQVPPPQNYPTDYVLMYDSVANRYFNMSITALVSAAQTSITAGARTQRSITTSPIVIMTNDQILNCAIGTVATCALPTAASRIGVPLTFKDLGQASAHNITISPSGGDTIDGLASIKLTNNFQTLTLVPLNDGTNAGWAVE
jgi:hypothetical protein